MKHKQTLLILLFCLTSCYLFGQKIVLDSAAYARWTSVESPIISNDGRYVAYDIKNKPSGHQTMVIQSTLNEWKREIIDAENWTKVISSDSKYLFFKKGRDSLGMLKLGLNDLRFISNVSSFELKANRNSDWLCYFLNQQEKTMVLRNLRTGFEKSYTRVLSYWFCDDNKVIVLKTISETNFQSLDWISLESGISQNIWKGVNLNTVVPDPINPQLAFTVDDRIMHYKFGEVARCIAEKITIATSMKMPVDRLVQFSKDGKRLYIDLKREDRSENFDDVVEIWSYQDAKLHTEQRADVEGTYLAAINLDTQDINLIGSGIVSFPAFLNSADTIALVQNWESVGEPWSVLSNINSRLVSAKNGKTVDLSFLNNNRNVNISGFGKFILYFDFRLNSYFSYEIATKKIRNITENIHTSWIDLRFSDDLSCIPRGIGCWFKDDSAILLYDEYDIWKVDPLNNIRPVNLTNGYGKRNKLIFDLALSVYKDNGLIDRQLLYLNAFDAKTKDNGFFAKIIGKVGDPKLLTMASVYFNSNATNYMPMGSDFNPVKAKDTEKYIVRRMSATEAPNYFITSDFKVFESLSMLQPEKRYNWYTSELHTWKSLDGSFLQGILYKPENFDPTKKYPVIFHYYERKTDGLNAYLKAEALCNGCNLNIPTYASQGYLVFTPDITYKIGDPMQGAYDAIISAAKYVSSLTYVNPKKMGIQGCSWGGLQTNYLITHSNLFAAACSASGIADLISAYGSLNGVEGEQQYGSRQFYFEGIGQQGRMGGSLWEKLDSYIKSSPVFQIDKVETPILIMHGKKDGRCSYYNVLEFFIGLRRLGKRAWMLVYPKAAHGIDDKKESDDFSLKMMEFFDHYLKDKSAPNWMFRSLKDENFSPSIVSKKDSLNEKSQRGLLRLSEQAKVDSLANRKQIKISLR